MSDFAAKALLVLICVVGLILTALRLPGTWLIVLTAGAYGWWTNWDWITPRWLVLLAVLAVAGEVVELLASMVTARRAGASRAAGWGGLIGGIAGMVVFSIPTPIIGTILGALLGCFLGAAMAEWLFGRSVDPSQELMPNPPAERSTTTHSVRVGFFAAVGFVLGTAAKTTIALIITGLLLTTVMCAKAPTP